MECFRRSSSFNNHRISPLTLKYEPPQLSLLSTFSLFIRFGSVLPLSFIPRLSIHALKPSSPSNEGGDEKFENMEETPRVTLKGLNLHGFPSDHKIRNFIIERVGVVCSHFPSYPLSSNRCSPETNETESAAPSLFPWLVLSHANVFKTVSDCFKHSNFFKVNDLELFFRPPFELAFFAFGPLGSAFYSSPTFPKFLVVACFQSSVFPETTDSVKSSGEHPEL